MNDLPVSRLPDGFQPPALAATDAECVSWFRGLRRNQSGQAHVGFDTEFTRVGATNILRTHLIQFATGNSALLVKVRVRFSLFEQIFLAAVISG